MFGSLAFCSVSVIRLSLHVNFQSNVAVMPHEVTASIGVGYISNHDLQGFRVYKPQSYPKP